MEKGKLTNQSSALRAARKIRQERKELRPDNYGKRKEAERIVRFEIVKPYEQLNIFDSKNLKL